MKNSRPGEDWFARLLRWAEDGESGPVQAEEPEPEEKPAPKGFREGMAGETSRGRRVAHPLRAAG